MQAAAEHLVDVAHGEGHVVEPALARRNLQQEQVVVAALGRAAHEGAAVRITVGRHEAEALRVERARALHVAHEEHDMADLDRRGAFVDRCGLVHARLGVPGVHGAAVDLDRALAADLQAHGQAVGVGAADAARAVDRGVGEGRVLRDGGGVAVQVGVAFHAPHHFAQRRALFHRGRQAGLVPRRNDHLAAVEALEDEFVGGFGRE
ncbi:hypothetical protein D3C72_1209380 [compost metagenome]